MTQATVIAPSIPSKAVVSDRLRKRMSRNIVATGVEILLLSAALVAVATTLGIIYVLVSESWSFFQQIPLGQFLTQREWTPLFDNPQFGIMVLLSGTVVSSVVALAVALPLGTAIAIYLSEFAKSRTREWIKPLLELLSGIPTIVYGYFALMWVTPLLQKIMPELSGFNLLSAGLVMGIMIVPYVSSMAEDAMRAVPMYLREGSFALGATRLQTAVGVVMPAATSGIASAYILGISRAIGETMILAVAAGMQPNLTLNPLEPAATVTAFIVQVALGDLPHGSLGYQTIFAAGLTLFLMTLFFNVLGHILRKKLRNRY
jgi:phosphate transport system permease protein